MPDITMCNGKNCPFNQTCYRYIATPSDYQSYYMRAPYKIVDGDIVCNYYWEVDLKKLKSPKRKES